MEKSSNNSQLYAIPLAIVVAAILISGAVIWGQNGPRAPKAPSGGTAAVGQPQQPGGGTTDAVRAVGPEDHIRGNPDAPVIIVEYSDFECPFCKRFHGTVKQALDEYGDQVAWVYRQSPLQQLHQKATREAIASECVAEQGGNDAFWQFADRFFEVTPSNDGTNLDTFFPQIIRETGIDEDQFYSCLESGRYDAHIQEDIQNAFDTGGGGTPWSIIIGADGTTYPLNGAQPYAALKQLIELAL